MKKGTELIAIERSEQIRKHGRTIEKDIIENNHGQLYYAAELLLFQEEDYLPFCEIPKGWDEQAFEKIRQKPYRERLIISGALIAAEIDRITECKISGDTNGEGKSHDQINYRGYEISTKPNEWGYYEAISLEDCDAEMITDKTLEGIIIHIDDMI